MRRAIPPVLAGIAIVVAAGAPLWAAEGIEALTRPSEDATLAFVRPGRVAKVLVKDGDDVKAGQELVRLDDQAELAQLAQLKAQAEDLIRIKAAEAQLAQKKVDLAKLEWAFQRNAATKLEVDHAKLDVLIAELSLDLANIQRAQDPRKYEEAKIQIDRMRLLSPIDGKVETVLVEPGESADALEKILRVVKTDPLWIDVPVTLPQTRGLKRGDDNVQVTFDYESPRPLRLAGKIIHIAAVADPASQTLTVRVEAPNPSGRPAGEHVWVSFATKTETASGGGQRDVAAGPRVKNPQ